jgi:spermidine/putrescine transport system permease protein
MLQRTARYAYLLLLYGFLYLPIVVLIVYSFNDSKYAASWQGFTWEWYGNLFDDDELLGVAVNSVTVALLAATRDDPRLGRR